MKHLDEPYAPRQGYQAPAPMIGGGLGAKSEPQRFAQFEVGKSGLALDPKPSTLSEDALPPMPSWDSAAKKHVKTEEEKNDVELGELDPATGQKIPLMTSAASPAMGGPPSPAHDMAASPYGHQPGQGFGGNGYMGVAVSDPHALPNAYNQNGYRGPHSPAPGRGRGGPDRGYGPASPMEGHGRGLISPQQDQYANDGFNSATIGYGRSQPQRQDSNDTYGSRQYPPEPQQQYPNNTSRPQNSGRQYSDQSYGADDFQLSGPPRGPSRGPGTRGPARVASPQLTNNAGFDFGSGGQQMYSRGSPPPQQTYGSRPSLAPQQDSYFGGNTAPPSYSSRSPPPAEESSYRGQSPYQAPSPGYRMPGGGRR